MIAHLLLSTALADTLPPGELLERAAAIHVTSQGFASIGAALGQLIPPTFTQDELAGEFECAASDPEPLVFTVNDLALDIAVLESSLVPSDGRLDLTLRLAVTGSAEEVIVGGSCSFFSFDEVCDLEIPDSTPIELGVHVGLNIALDESAGDGRFIVTVEPPEIDLGEIPNPLVAADTCFMAEIIDWQMRSNPDFLNDLVWSILEPLVDDLGPTLEEPLEDALGSLTMDTSFALGSSEIDLHLQPTLFRLDEAGLALGLGAAMAPSSTAACIGAHPGPTVSGEGWPELGASSWDGAVSHDAAIALSRDFADSLLWSVWATGTFCLEVSDLAGVSLGSDLLGQLYGEEFQALFPVNVPALIQVNAASPPVSRFDDQMPLYIELRDLLIDTASELDDRQDRVCQVSTSGDIGVSLALSDNTFAPELLIDPAALTFRETYSELLGPGYAAGIAEFLPTVLGSLLPSDLLPTIAVPSVQGIGLGDLHWAVSPDTQWLGGFASIDAQNVEPLNTDGCAGALGCDGGGGDPGDLFGCSDGGCGGCEGQSCTTGGAMRLPGGRLALFAAMVVLAALRRKE